MNYQEILRRLAIGDGSVIASAHQGSSSQAEPCRLDARTRSFARLGASVAVGASASGFQEHVNAALAAGATISEVVGVLIAVQPAVGLARVVSAAPALGLALGYDPENALEDMDQVP